MCPDDASRHLLPCRWRFSVELFSAMVDKNNLAWRLVRRGLAGPLITTALLFIPAGSLRFWQGWVVTGLGFGALVCFGIYFHRHDPEVIGRRLLRKEKLDEQRRIIALWRILGASSLVLAGLDHRLGWSGTLLSPVPLWLELLSMALIFAAYILHFEVLKANRFAASVIQIEAGQSVSAAGPYGLIRHPMYLGFAVIALFTPLALGSFIALPCGVLIIGIIICRLLNEEKFLRRDLAGYPDYCRQTRHRLIPFVW